MCGEPGSGYISGKARVVGGTTMEPSLGLPVELERVVRKRITHTANQFWASLKAGLPATQMKNNTREFEGTYDYMFTMACPPNLVADRWAFSLEGFGEKDYYVLDGDRNRLRKYIDLDHADQILGDVIDFDKIYVRHWKPKSLVVVYIRWKER